MRKVINLPLVAILLFLFSNTLMAQTASVDTIGDNVKSTKKASLKFGVNYLSNSVFLGRADTVKTPLIEPEIKYTFKSGIYFSANMDIIPNRATHELDGGSFSGGYDFDITDDLSGGASYTKLFYAASSTQISSTISSTFNANLSYDIADIITPSVSADYNLLTQGFGSDIILNFGLAHDFAKEGIFGENDIGIFSPTATVNAGTQNFYDAYLVQKKYKLTKKGEIKQKLLAKQDAKLAQFSLLDYEFSAPIEYKTGPLILSFTPTYAIAQNKLPARITSSMVDTSNGLFYFEVGASLKF